ncbi:RNA polymerase II subunit A C-terminal domain phosphatase-like isoform X2 [Dysidea avara]
MLIEERCMHSIVVHDMCADCGANLRKYEGAYGELTQPVTAQVSMIHSIPGIRVSQEEAERLARQDQLRLLRGRKLALIVDLDQTLIHTAVSPGIEGGLPDVHRFTLPEHPHMTYHTRLRPHVRDFLEKVSKLYELHISTMGCRSYADKIAGIIDPEKRYFSSRVISRDECVDPTSKVLRLRSVFPCGDRMVAIIDDREDVWCRAPNLIHVKPYMFFSGVSDINAPPNAPSEPRPSEQDADNVSAIAGNSSGNNAETTEPNTECNTEVPETGETLQTSETKPNPSEYTESDKEGSDSESSSSVDSSGSSSSGVSSVNSTNGLSQDPPDSSSVQVDVPASMITTASALQNPTPETKEDIPATEEPVLKSDVDPSHKEVEKKSGPHPSVSRIRRLPSDIQDPDDFLVHLAVTLSKIHDIFYTEYDTTANTGQQPVAGTSSHVHTPDLKEIIPSMRQSVLKDCNILFTGVIPTNMPPERCPEWNTARAFGATIHSTLVGNVDTKYQPTTHLIVGRVGTSKLHEARRMPGIKIVECGWLWASAERWQRVDEVLYPVKESKLPRKEEKQHQDKPTAQADNNRLERLMSTGSVSVALISDEDLVEMDKEVDAEMDDDLDSDNSDSDNENGLDANDRIIEGSRKRKLSESPQSLSSSSEIAKSSDDEDDDDEYGALLEAQIS